jgi:hypothetical protein
MDPLSYLIFSACSVLSAFNNPCNPPARHRESLRRGGRVCSAEGGTRAKNTASCLLQSASWQGSAVN